MTQRWSGLRLTLVRHGHAQSHSEGNRDFDRALDRRGIGEVAELARRCLDLGLVPDLLVASAALRTVQTAEALLRALEPSPPPLQIEPSLYLAESATLLERIRSTTPPVGHLMIIAHNPGLSELAQQLAPTARLPEFETSASCSMAFAALTWRGIGTGVAEAVRYDSPGRHLQP